MKLSNPAGKRPVPVSFSVQRGSRRAELTYQQLFATGHRFWLASRWAEAERVFEHLSTVSDRGPRAHILLAHCKVMLGDYAGCSSLLAAALPTEDYGSAASDLHDTFVLWKVSFFSEVKHGLERVIAEHPELPTPCLILGDLLMRTGNRQQPPRLFQQAIDRDRSDGAIAAIAQVQLPAARKGAFAQRSHPPTRTKRVAQIRGQG
jgi:hypothetical protein